MDRGRIAGGKDAFVGEHWFHSTHACPTQWRSFLVEPETFGQEVCRFPRCKNLEDTSSAACSRSFAAYVGRSGAVFTIG